MCVCVRAHYLPHHKFYNASSKSNKWHGTGASNTPSDKKREANRKREKKEDSQKERNHLITRKKTLPPESDDEIGGYARSGLKTKVGKNLKFISLSVATTVFTI